MKNLQIIFVLFIFPIFVFGQEKGDTITFELKDGRVVLPSKKENLEFPLTIRISKVFDEDSIFISNVNETDESQIKKILLSESELFTFDGNFYQFTMKNILIDYFPITCSDGICIVIRKETYSGNFYNKNQGNKSKSNGIYLDALNLSKNIRNSEKKFILLNYIDDSYFDTTNSALVKNHFLDSLINAINTISDENNKNLYDNPFLSSLGNTDVTYFATGLSRFLAERAKAELNEAFFSQMKTELNKNEYLKTIFPQTVSILNKIENFGYASMLQVLKSAFETDMYNLSYNLYSLKYTSNCNNFFKTTKGQWLALGLSTVNTAKTATNPADFLNTLTKTSDFAELKETLKNKKETNFLSFIELNNVISQSLLSKEINQVWITQQDFNELLKPDVFRIYLGLLLAKEQQKQRIEKDTLFFYSDKNQKISFDSILIKAYKDNNWEQQFGSLIRNAYSTYQMGNNAVKELLANKKDTITSAQALYEFYRTTVNAIRPVAYSIANSHKIDVSALNRIENLLNPAVDLVYHIAIKQYSSAIFDVSILLDSCDSIDNNTKKSLTKYGTLIANVASAQSSDEVKKAIEASALPVGSSAMKRNSSFSIFLNAYVGGYYGQTTNKYCIQDSINNSKGFIRSYGVYAPIGISLNISGGSWLTFSLTANILELGSLVNVYLKDGDNAVLPEDFKVRLIDIISPGLQLSWLIGKTPLSVFAGTNYIPKLYPQADNSYKSGWRWQVGLAIDIPMYKIHICDK
jgi:hypothetical protein